MVATGVDEKGNTLQSGQRLKEIENIVSSFGDEHLKLRALLVGLGSITKDSERLG